MSTTLGTLLVNFFRTYLANQKGTSPNTIASYSDCIRILITYCCQRFAVSVDQLTVESINDSVIIDFLDHLEHERGNTPATRNQRLDVIKSFFRFIALQEPTLITTFRPSTN